MKTIHIQINTTLKAAYLCLDGNPLDTIAIVDQWGLETEEGRTLAKSKLEESGLAPVFELVN